MQVALLLLVLFQIVYSRTIVPFQPSKGLPLAAIQSLSELYQEEGDVLENIVGFSVTLNSKGPNGEVDANDVFSIAVDFDDQPADATAKIQYLDTKTGKMKYMTMTRTSSLEIPTSTLGDVVVSFILQNGKESLSCQKLLFKSKNHPAQSPDTWYSLEPDANFLEKLAKPDQFRQRNILLGIPKATGDAFADLAHELLSKDPADDRAAVITIDGSQHEKGKLRRRQFGFQRSIHFERILVKRDDTAKSASTCRLVAGLKTACKTVLPPVMWQTLKNTNKRVKIFLKRKKTGGVEVVREENGVAEATTLSTKKDSISMIESIFNSALARGVKKVIDAFKYVFSWKDIIAAQRVFVHAVERLPDILQVGARMLQKQAKQYEDQIQESLKKSEANLDSAQPLANINDSPVTDMDQVQDSNRVILNLIVTNDHVTVKLVTEVQDKVPGENPEGIPELFKAISNENKDFKPSGNSRDLIGKKNGLGNFLKRILLKVQKSVSKIASTGLQTIKIPIISNLWKKMVGQPITIVGVLALFAAIPGVVLGKVFSLGKLNLVPQDKVDEYTSWTAQDIKAHYLPEELDKAHLAQSTRLRKSVDTVLTDIYPVFTALSRIWADGIVKVLKESGASTVLGPVKVFNWVLYVLSDVPIPDLEPGKKVYNNLIMSNYALTWGVNALLLQSALAYANPLYESMAAWGLTVKGCTDIGMNIATLAVVKSDSSRHYKSVALKATSKIVRGIAYALSGPASIYKSAELMITRAVIATLGDLILLGAAFVGYGHHDHVKHSDVDASGHGSAHGSAANGHSGSDTHAAAH